MKARMRLLTLLNAVFLLAALGCGDEGGCGPAPQKKEEAGGGGGGGGLSGNKGSSSGSAELNAGDKKGRVPKPYRRPASAYEPEKSTATISKPVIAVSSATAPGGKAAKLGIAQITKRKVDGVADRVEVSCRIMAASPDGQCSSAANYGEIKDRCCPGGLVERCRTTMSGVVLIGRGCDIPKR
jgi:hypothetical protein